MAGSPKFYELLDRIRALHDAKNHDYAGDSDPFKNFRESERFGICSSDGVLIRMSDKWSRITNLVLKERLDVAPQVNEAIEDTLMDLAVYSLIAIILREEEKSRSDA